MTTESRVEPRFSTAATTLAGRAVDVRCYSYSDWARLDAEWRAWVGRDLSGTNGYVRRSDPGKLHLSPGICGRLVEITYTGYRPRQPERRRFLGEALLVLAHEAQHSAGVLSEPVADCYGLQRVRPLARMLGVPKAYAAILARAALQVSQRNPTHLRSKECRNGGQLDLNPKTNIWP